MAPLISGNHQTECAWAANSSLWAAISSRKVAASVIISSDAAVYRDNGKENGNYYSLLGIPLKGFIGIILGIYWDNGKENGSCFRVHCSNQGSPTF